MARGAWFDEQSNEILFSEYATKMESWEKAMADGVIDPDEIDQQANRLVDMLRDLEPKLNDALHKQITDVFYELAVLYGMVQTSEMALLEEEANK